MKLKLRAEAIGAFTRAVQGGDKEGMAFIALARLYREENKNPANSALCFMRYLLNCYPLDILTLYPLLGTCSTAAPLRTRTRTWT
jgi:hypothetical protein